VALAAIYFCLSSEFSFHPAPRGTSREISPVYPIFHSEKTGRLRNIAKSVKERKLKWAKIGQKMKIFLSHWWIFPAKNNDSRGVHQLISRLSLCCPRIAGFAYFRAVCRGHLEWAQLAFVLF